MHHTLQADTHLLSCCTALVAVVDLGLTKYMVTVTWILVTCRVVKVVVFFTANIAATTNTV